MYYHHQQQRRRRRYDIIESERQAVVVEKFRFESATTSQLRRRARDTKTRSERVSERASERASYCVDVFWTSATTRRREFWDSLIANQKNDCVRYGIVVKQKEAKLCERNKERVEIFIYPKQLMNNLRSRARIGSPASWDGKRRGSLRTTRRRGGSISSIDWKRIFRIEASKRGALTDATGVCLSS